MDEEIRDILFTLKSTIEQTQPSKLATIAKVYLPLATALIVILLYINTAENNHTKEITEIKTEMTEAKAHCQFNFDVLKSAFHDKGKELYLYNIE